MQVEISKDLLGISPDVKRFKKKSNIMIDNLRNAMRARISEKAFRLIPQLIPASVPISEDQAIQNYLNKNKFKQEERRSVLGTRETDDNELDYVGMSLLQVSELNADKAAKAYTQLVKAAKPVFSGSTDPLVNKLDTQKVKQKLVSAQKM